mmetsp:Transcript_62794/g.130561  ORF Transcript_62794/g.130561 Transcript_62794/m.130561 type:complete len:442 (-) Transcript_62794:87-1412(-)
MAARMLVGARNVARHMRPAVSRASSCLASTPRPAAVVHTRAFLRVPASRSFSSVSSFTLEDPEEMIYPNEDPANGLSYDLNWSICGSGVVPQGLAFRNLKSAQLQAAGGLNSIEAPQELPFSKEIDKEVTEGLGENGLTLYVQDMALGALLANEVPVRIVSDSAAAASMFKDLCSTTRPRYLPEYQEAACVLLLSKTKFGPFVSTDPKEKTIYVGGTINASAVVPALQQFTTDAFLEKGVLPLWGSGGADAVFLSDGFEDGATVKHGFAYSSAGFCRMFMGSVSSDGSVVSEYSAMPNSLELPKAVVMFADDASNTLPAASQLSAAQAAFYYVSSCAPAGCTKFEAAAQVVMQMAESVPFYMVNKAAFSDKQSALDAARDLPGKSGGSADALGLKVVDVSGASAQATGAEFEAGAKALADKVASLCKSLDAVVAAGPSVPK